MLNITFCTNKAGTVVANWPGKTVMTDRGPRKEGQRYLGKIINRDKLIFWTRNEGYYIFNPEDQTIQTIAPEDLPTSSYVTKQQERANRNADVAGQKVPKISNHENGEEFTNILLIFRKQQYFT